MGAVLGLVGQAAGSFCAEIFVFEAGMAVIAVVCASVVLSVWGRRPKAQP
jgi:hypothetical protein